MKKAPSLKILNHDHDFGVGLPISSAQITNADFECLSMVIKIIYLSFIVFIYCNLNFVGAFFWQKIDFLKWAQKFLEILDCMINTLLLHAFSLSITYI